MATVQCLCCKKDGTRCKHYTKSETCNHHKNCPYGRSPCSDEIDETLLYAPIISPRASPDIDDIQEFSISDSPENISSLALAVQESLKTGPGRVKTSKISDRKKRCKGINKNGKRCKNKSYSDYCKLHSEQELNSLLQELYISYLDSGMEPNEAGAQVLKEYRPEIQDEYLKYTQKLLEDGTDEQKQIHPDYIQELITELSRYGITSKKDINENKEQIVSMINYMFPGHDPEDIIKKIKKNINNR